MLARNIRGCVNLVANPDFMEQAVIGCVWVVASVLRVVGTVQIVLKVFMQQTANTHAVRFANCPLLNN